jgi:hypothetical protein
MKAKRQQGQSNHELVTTVGAALKEYLDKADNMMKQAKNISPKELAIMKKIYNAASAFTALVN